ncbi:hypothetical protein HZS_993 [Henneguya salminicola]|nr:hypothetical protein HZS_993 [Henneguya salminicola]
MHGSLPSTSNVPPEIGTLIIIDRKLGKSKYLLTDIEPKGKQITSVSDIKKFVSNELKKIQMQQKNLIMCK